MLKIASAHNWNIISENFVRRTEKVVGQSVRQLKIFISRLVTRLKFCQCSSASFPGPFHTTVSWGVYTQSNFKNNVMQSNIKGRTV